MRVAKRSRKARSWVTTIADGCFASAFSSCSDAVEVEVVGRLVEQQQLGLEREREGERRALRLPARGRLGREVLVHLEAVQELGEPRLGAPALPLVVDRRNVAAQQQARPQRRRVRQLRLLLHQRHPQAVALPQLAVVERRRAGDDAEQRGLAGAVAADQPDALAGFHHEGSAVEQRQLTVGELGVGEGQEGHC